MTKLLCETPALLTGAFASQWIPVLQSLVALIELPEDQSVPDDEHFIEIEDTPGYQSAYSQLVFAGGKNRKEVALINKDENVRAYLAQSLHKASTAHPGMIPPLVGQLEHQVKHYLEGYLHAAHVAIS